MESKYKFTIYIYYLHISYLIKYNFFSQDDIFFNQTKET